MCGLISWALSFRAWHPGGPLRVSPFPQLLVPVYLILFWSFSAAFLIMAGPSYFAFKDEGIAFLKDMLWVCCAYTTIQVLLTSSAIGIAAASSPDGMLPLFIYEELELEVCFILTFILVLHCYGAEGRRKSWHLPGLKFERMPRANGDGLLFYHHDCFQLPIKHLPFLKVFLAEQKRRAAQCKMGMEVETETCPGRSAFNVKISTSRR